MPLLFSHNQLMKSAGQIFLHHFSQDPAEDLKNQIIPSNKCRNQSPHLNLHVQMGYETLPGNFRNKAPNEILLYTLQTKLVYAQTLSAEARTVFPASLQNIFLYLHSGSG